MTRIRKVFLAVVVLTLIGCAFLLGQYLGRAHSVGKEVSYRAAITVHLLDRLYAGDTNRAIAVLDGMLDQDTYSMAVARRQILLPSVRDQIDRVLSSRVARFRQDHPRKPLQAEIYDPKTDHPSRQAMVERQNTYADHINREVGRVLEEVRDKDRPTTGPTVPPEAGASSVQ